MKRLFLFTLAFNIFFSLFALGGEHSLSKFESWWAKNSQEYAGHAIAPDNVASVLEGGVLRPGELTLRELGRVSFEKGNSTGDRAVDEVPKAQIEAFAREHPLPPVCEGVEHVRIRSNKEGYDVQIKKPRSNHWETLRHYSGAIANAPDAPYVSAAIEADVMLFEKFTGEDGKLVDLNFPVPYCPRFDQRFNQMSNLPTSITLHSSFWFGEQKTGRNDYVLKPNLALEEAKAPFKQFADANGFDLNALAIVSDEINGRKADKRLALVKAQYYEALAEFEQAYLREFPGRQQQLEDLMNIGPQGTFRTWFNGARISQYFGPLSGKLKTNISFIYNGVATPYGNTVILLGSEEVARVIPLLGSEGLERARSRFTNTYPFAEEIESRFSLETGFTVINLHSPNILIVGPKSEVGQFKDRYPNIVFKEDLTPEQVEEINGPRNLYTR